MLEKIHRGRFLFLLISLLFILMVGPHVEADFAGIEFLDILFIIIMLSGINVVSKNKKIFIGAMIAAFMAVSSVVLTDVLRNPYFALSKLSFYIAFFALVAVAILSSVLMGGKITTDKIYGSICAYLIIGVIFALLYDILESAQPGSFLLQGEIINSDNEVWERNLFAHLIYYSFVTLTTLGYGDIVPVSPFARTFAALEAVTGQLYIAVLIARLVGLHIVHSSSKSEE
jgi:hypothetical protein